MLNCVCAQCTLPKKFLAFVWRSLCTGTWWPCLNLGLSIIINSKFLNVIKTWVYVWTYSVLPDSGVGFQICQTIWFYRFICSFIFSLWWDCAINYKCLPVEHTHTRNFTSHIWTFKGAHCEVYLVKSYTCTHLSTYTHAHTHAHVHTQLQTRTFAHIHSYYTHACTHTHVHAHIHNIHTHMHTQMHAHTHMHTHALAHTHAHICTHACTHTHMVSDWQKPLHTVGNRCCKQSLITWLPLRFSMLVL